MMVMRHWVSALALAGLSLLAAAEERTEEETEELVAAYQAAAIFASLQEGLREEFREATADPEADSTLTVTPLAHWDAGYAPSFLVAQGESAFGRAKLKKGDDLEVVMLEARGDRFVVHRPQLPPYQREGKRTLYFGTSAQGFALISHDGYYCVADPAGGPLVGKPMRGVAPDFYVSRMFPLGDLTITNGRRYATRERGKQTIVYGVLAANGDWRVGLEIKDHQHPIVGELRTPPMTNEAHGLVYIGGKKGLAAYDSDFNLVASYLYEKSVEETTLTLEESHLDRKPRMLSDDLIAVVDSHNITLTLLDTRTLEKQAMIRVDSRAIHPRGYLTAGVEEPGMALHDRLLLVRPGTVDSDSISALNLDGPGRAAAWLDEHHSQPEIPERDAEADVTLAELAAIPAMMRSVANTEDLRRLQWSRRLPCLRIPPMGLVPQALTLTDAGLFTAADGGVLQLSPDDGRILAFYAMADEAPPAAWREDEWKRQIPARDRYARIPWTVAVTDGHVYAGNNRVGCFAWKLAAGVDMD